MGFSLKKFGKGVANLGKKALTEYNPVAGLAQAGVHLAKGDVGGALKSATAGATFGGSDIAIDGAKKIGGAIKSGFNAPYDEVKNAEAKAGQDVRDLGTSQRDYYEKGLGTAKGEYDQTQDTYNKTVGAGPGLYEQHLADSMAGTNKYYDQARQDSARNLDSAFAARGVGNSGAALEANARMNADMGAKQGHDLDAQLAQAQTLGDARNKTAFNSQMGIADAKSGLDSGFMGKAGSAYESGQLAGINSDLARAGVDLSKRRDAVGAVGALAGAGAQALPLLL